MPVLLHEVGHTWSSTFGEGDVYSPPLSSQGHWRAGIGAWGSIDYPTMDIISVMSPKQNGFQVVSEAPCELVYLGARAFDEWDLYLMGLMPSADLPDVLAMYRVVRPPLLDGVSRGSCDLVDRLTVASVVAAHGGERDPRASAPQAFDFSLVVVSPDAFTDAEYLYYDRLSRWFESSEEGAFSPSTGGLATLSSSL